MQYLTSLGRFMSMEIRKDITLEECLNLNQNVMINEMRGKNHVFLCLTQRTVKVEMHWFMPNPCTVCY